MDDAYHHVGTVRKNSAEEIRIALSEFRGSPLIDVRIFCDIEGLPDDRVATKKGVALSIRALPDLIQVLQSAEREARRRGLIPRGS